jgi:hypothetical protein
MYASRPVLDLMPPPFAEGLDDWSWGNGTPDTPTYDEAPFARIASADPDFGTCLEMRKIAPVQRLRYMGELPLPPSGFIEITARVKALRGPLATVRIAGWAGSAGGRAVPGLVLAAEPVEFPCHCAVVTLRAVVGRLPLDGVDLVWDDRAIYAHVGLDLLGADKGVVRIADLSVRDVSARFLRENVAMADLAEAIPPTRFRN